MLKQTVTSQLIATGNTVAIFVDVGVNEVQVPAKFYKECAAPKKLQLHIGLNMANPIPDLELNEWGILCTLSFQGRRQTCRLPWASIAAAIDQVTYQGAIFTAGPDPFEVGTPPPTRLRPKLRVIPGGKK